MQLVAFAVTLCLLTSSPVFAGFGYLYRDLECSGDPVAAIDYAEGACQLKGNFRAECNETHAYQVIYDGPDCTGNSEIDPDISPLEICVQGTRAYCNKTINAPQNSFIQSTWDSSSCSGRPASSVFSILNECVPNYEEHNSWKYSYDEDQGLTHTVWDTTTDCTGFGDSEEVYLGSLSVGHTTTSRHSLSSDLLYINHYVDPHSCTGTVYSGVATRAGLCDEGVVMECVNNRFIQWVYDNQDCTGDREMAMNVTPGECQVGWQFHSVQAFCSGTMDIPANAFTVEEFDMGIPCSGHHQRVSYWLTDTCHPVEEEDTWWFHEESRTFSYDSVSDTVELHAWEGHHCRGDPAISVQIRLLSFSYNITNTTITNAALAPPPPSSPSPTSATSPSSPSLSPTSPPTPTISPSPLPPAALPLSPRYISNIPDDSPSSTIFSSLLPTLLMTLLLTLRVL